MTGFPVKNKEITHTDIVKNRTANLNGAFTAIEEAQTVIRSLEQMATQRADGKCLDIASVAELTHRLRACTDRILVGLVESQTLPGVYYVS